MISARVIPLLLALALPVAAQETLPADMRGNIDKAVKDVLSKTGVPSASIAVVRDGKIVYTHAYGTARIDPMVAATPDMRYSIGSISKQFTASAILLLAEEGKLSLDDKVAKWFPDLTRANDITVRQVLTMTAGYEDFWPQDYVMPMMLHEVTPQQILNDWAKKPLDYEPGTKWQYSNTDYILAGMIVEKVSGMPLLDFLKQHIFTPLHMTSVYDSDRAPLGPDQPERYLRYALGPLRVAPKEGRGWMFAAGELAMTAHDLALWDISLIDQSILKPASYHALETEQLAAGIGTHYGLGVGLARVDGRRSVQHGGEVSGFTATNQVFPDDRAAVVVMTNIDASDASEQIATEIGTLLFATSDKESKSALAQMKRIFEELQHGKIDRSLFTSNANAYFTDEAVGDFRASLAPLGTPEDFTEARHTLRGGMTLRGYVIKFPKRTLRLKTFIMPDGKIEQYQIAAAD